jgi:hypothetical protein
MLWPSFRFYAVLSFSRSRLDTRLETICLRYGHRLSVYTIRMGRLIITRFVGFFHLWSERGSVSLQSRAPDFGCHSSHLLPDHSYKGVRAVDIQDLDFDGLLVGRQSIILPDSSC